MRGTYGNAVKGGHYEEMSFHLRAGEIEGISFTETQSRAFCIERKSERV